MTKQTTIVVTDALRVKRTKIVIKYSSLSTLVIYLGINHVSGRGDYSWQDSKITSSEGFSYLALDGIYTSSWSGMSCMHTGDRYNPWWAVDFGSFVKVKRINIYQRTDSCCGKYGGVDIEGLCLVKISADDNIENKNMRKYYQFVVF